MWKAKKLIHTPGIIEYIYTAIYTRVKVIAQGWFHSIGYQSFFFWFNNETSELNGFLAARLGIIGTCLLEHFPALKNSKTNSIL